MQGFQAIMRKGYLHIVGSGLGVAHGLGGGGAGLSGHGLVGGVTTGGGSNSGNSTVTITVTVAVSTTVEMTVSGISLSLGSGEDGGNKKDGQKLKKLTNSGFIYKKRLLLVNIVKMESPQVDGASVKTLLDLNL